MNAASHALIATANTDYDSPSSLKIWRYTPPRDSWVSKGSDRWERLKRWSPLIVLAIILISTYGLLDCSLKPSVRDFSSQVLPFNGGRYVSATFNGLLYSL